MRVATAMRTKWSSAATRPHREPIDQHQPSHMAPTWQRGVGSGVELLLTMKIAGTERGGHLPGVTQPKRRGSHVSEEGAKANARSPPQGRGHLPDTGQGLPLVTAMTVLSTFNTALEAKAHISSVSSHVFPEGSGRF